jgi:hypothetical protein
MGEHNALIYGKLLGYSESMLEELKASDVI